jgi:hypothetical protein
MLVSLKLSRLYVYEGTLTDAVSGLIFCLSIVHVLTLHADEGLETLASMNLGRLHIYDCALTDAVSNEGELNLEWNRYKVRWYENGTKCW